MKIHCAWCEKEGKPAYLGEQAPLDDQSVTHTICEQHSAEMQAQIASPKTLPELEEFALFAVMVAGKTADGTRKKLAQFLGQYHWDHPFQAVRWYIKEGRLGRELRRAKVGQYRRINAAFRGLVGLDPQTCSVQDLEAIKGIGPKTARFFILHTRPGTRVAALDTHILKFLKSCDVKDVPRSTPPSGPKYARLEREFLRIADLLGRDPKELDLEIWNGSTKKPFPGGVVYAR